MWLTGLRWFVVVAGALWSLAAPAWAEDAPLVPIYEGFQLIENATLTPRWTVALGDAGSNPRVLSVAGNIWVVGNGKITCHAADSGQQRWQQPVAVERFADSVAVAPDGSAIAVVTTNPPGVSVFNAAGKAVRCRIKRATGVTFLNPHKVAVAAERTLTIVNLTSGRPQRVIPLFHGKPPGGEYDGDLYALTLHPLDDGHALFYDIMRLTGNGACYVQNLLTGHIDEVETYWESNGTITWRFDRNTRFALSTWWTHPGDGGFTMGRVQQFSKTGVIMRKIATGSSCVPMAFDGDDHRIALLWELRDPESSVWLDVVDTRTSTVRRMRASDVQGCCFTADGRLALVKSVQGKATLSVADLP